MIFRRILIDVDALEPDDAALHRGAELASRSGATMTVVDVLPHVPNGARRFVTQTVEAELVADRLTRMRAAVERLDPPQKAETNVLRGEVARAVADEALRGDFDLVVRRRGHDRSDPLPASRSLDRRLVRECPCPVWLLSAGPHTVPRRILAAVDLASDPASLDLATSVLDAAGHIASIYRADLTVLHAYHLEVEEMLATYVPPEAIHDLKREAEQEAIRQIHSLIARVDLKAVQPRPAVAYGEPEGAIPEYARSHDMDLVVLGTVSRSGLARLVLGSTAERVLHELDRSTFIVKPRGPEVPGAEVPA